MLLKVLSNVLIFIIIFIIIKNLIIKILEIKIKKELSNKSKF